MRKSIISPIDPIIDQTPYRVKEDDDEKNQPDTQHPWREGEGGQAAEVGDREKGPWTQVQGPQW
jgi:hypothetical protein